jgi:plastocyanin
MRFAKCLLLAVPPCLMSMPAFAVDHQVMVLNFQYSPQNVNIASGDTVTFVNNSGFHSATSDDSGTTFNKPAASASWTFTTPPLTASIGYHCTVHGSPGNGMFGTITLLVPVRLQSFEVD